MLSLFNSAIDQVNKAMNKVQVLTASIAPQTLIKPEIKKEIEKLKQKYEIHSKTLKTIKSLNQSKLKSAIDKVNTQVSALFHEVLSDDMLNLLAEIMGNHISEFPSIDVFKKTLTESKGTNEIIAFLSKLIDIENYAALKDKVLAFEEFDTLSPEYQLRALEIDPLINKIQRENESLNINALKINMKEKVESLSNELGCSEEETAILQSLFDNLADTFLPKLNQNRLEMVNHLPEYLKNQKQKALEAHPELVIGIEGGKEKKCKEMTPHYQKQSKKIQEIQEIQEVQKEPKGKRKRANQKVQELDKQVKKKAKKKKR